MYDCSTGKNVDPLCEKSASFCTSTGFLKSVQEQRVKVILILQRTWLTQESCSSAEYNTEMTSVGA